MIKIWWSSWCSVFRRKSERLVARLHFLDTFLLLLARIYILRPRHPFLLLKLLARHELLQIDFPWLLIPSVWISLALLEQHLVVSCLELLALLLNVSFKPFFFLLEPRLLSFFLGLLLLHLYSQLFLVGSHFPLLVNLILIFLCYVCSTNATRLRRSRRAGSRGLR